MDYDEPAPTGLSRQEALHSMLITVKHNQENEK
jgi:hypothetical protein